MIRWLVIGLCERELDRYDGARVAIIAIPHTGRGGAAGFALRTLRRHVVWWLALRVSLLAHQVDLVSPPHWASLLVRLGRKALGLRAPRLIPSDRTASRP